MYEKTLFLVISSIVGCCCGLPFRDLHISAIDYGFCSLQNGHPFQTQLNIHIYTSCTFYLAQELAPLTTQKVHWQLNYWDYKKGLAAFSIIDICRGRICF